MINKRCNLLQGTGGPLEDECLKAGQLGRGGGGGGLSTTSHSTCIGPYRWSGLEKKVQGDCQSVYVCT